MNSLITTNAITFAALASFVSLASAWTGPTSTPPNANADAPINVGATSQIKLGTLGAYGLYLSGSSPQYINFSSTLGSTGFGIRNNAGTLEYKNSGGNWAAFGSAGQWSVSGSDLYYTAGDVGVGTASPEDKLHLSGNFVQENSNVLQAKNSAGSIETWMWPRYSDNVTYTNFGSGGWNIRNNSSQSAIFISAAKNVGIQTTNNTVYDSVAAPKPLVVVGTDSSTTLNGSSSAITVSNASTTTNNSAQLNFASITGANTNHFSSAIISAIFGARTNGQYPTGQIVFSTSSALNSAPTEKMRIDAPGTVAVATSATTVSNASTIIPRLLIAQNGATGGMQVTRHTSPGAGGAIATLTSTRGTDVNNYTTLTNGDGLGSIIFGGADGSQYVTGAMIRAQSSGAVSANTLPTDLLFLTSNSGANNAQERMRIESAGNVTIGGIPSAGLQLRVWGSIGSTNTGAGGTPSLLVRAHPSQDLGEVGTTSNHPMIFITNAVERMRLNANGDLRIGASTVTPTAQLHTTGSVRFATFGAGTLQTDASGNLSVSSDERLKHVDGPYLQGLDAVIKLNPILYHWNKTSGLETEYQYAGFSAQDVEKALPEAVGYDERGMRTLQDRAIIAALVNAVQEQQKQIDMLTKEVNALSSQK